ncbi:thiopeptide-type bacteriocin biosynthesis protein [Micromonospora sp. LOL_025]|uniref:thiopeptide-type bacteriocin biosynthesis protein n=1 Tax=Micromonospora sp. LOL_025 TaxID=3345413 RepID=UPI003A8C1137
MTPSKPFLSTPGWCLLRVPVLPAVPHGDSPAGTAQRSRQILELAVDYADTFQRAEQDDQGWQDQPTRLAVYGNRARFRPTPFGIFSFNLLADLVDNEPTTHLDLETEVRLRRVDLPRPTGNWFVNPTLAVNAGRWSYVRPDKGGTTSLADRPAVHRLAERLAELRTTAPRSAEEWAADLGAGGTAQFDLCVRQDLLLAEQAPTMLVETGAPVAPADPVKAALTEERPFLADQFVDAFSEVRAALSRSQVTALIDGVAEVMRIPWRPERLDRVREYVAGAFTGGAVPLAWLLAAPVDHPLGSWRRPPQPADATRPPDGVRRLFVPRHRRDNGAVQWWTSTLTLDQWRAGLPEEPASRGSVWASPNAPRFGMACGALLAEPCSGADAWLKLIVPGWWGGPGARLAEHLRLPDHDPRTADPTRLTLELGWVPSDGRAPLARRRVGDTPRLNLNLPHRRGDVGVADLAVIVVDGRLQLVHRADGRPVEVQWDSPLVLTHPRNPWVVQLLGLLRDEASDTMPTADPSQRRHPGELTPRITADRCLLARRSLVLDAQHRADLLDLAVDPVALCDVLSEVGLGPQVEVTEEADLTMRLDLTDTGQRQWFTRRLRRTGPMVLHESLPLATPVRTDLGGHVHDVWVPWGRPGSPPRPPLSRTRMVDTPPAADPEWTSWYVYAPERVTETWLARADMVALMRRADCFYIRYRDERPHLRVRVRSTVDAGALLADLRAHLATTLPQQPGEIEVRPWVPEDYRYGGTARRTETLRHFCADSAWWTQRLAVGPDQAGRYALAVSRIAAWSRQLAGDDGALALLCDLRGLDPRLPSSRAQREWMSTFRSARPALEQALDAALAEPERTLDHLTALDADAYRLTLNSMIHMTVNRGLPLGQAVAREPEIVLAAARLLKGRAARGEVTSV